MHPRHARLKPSSRSPLRPATIWGDPDVLSPRERFHRLLTPTPRRRWWQTLFARFTERTPHHE